MLPPKEKRKEVLGILSIYKYVLLFMVYLESQILEKYFCVDRAIEIKLTKYGRCTACPQSRGQREGTGEVAHHIPASEFLCSTEQDRLRNSLPKT